MEPPPKLSLIIPLYNEQKRVKKGLTQIKKFLQTQNFSWEIIVIDDGSTDSTSWFVKTFLDQNTHLIRTAQNFGKGHAIRLGVEVAEGNYINFSDIDLSVPINFTEEILRELKTADLAVGSRRLSESQVKKHQNKLRESLGHRFTQLSNFILNLDLTDHTCGFKGFKSSVAKRLFSLQKINRWAFDSEILFLAKKLNFKVKEIPVTWRNDSHTKVNLLSDVFSSFISLLSIRTNRY